MRSRALACGCEVSVVVVVGGGGGAWAVEQWMQRRGAAVWTTGLGEGQVTSNPLKNVFRSFVHFWSPAAWESGFLKPLQTDIALLQLVLPFSSFFHT